MQQNFSFFGVRSNRSADPYLQFCNLFIRQFMPLEIHLVRPERSQLSVLKYGKGQNRMSQIFQYKIWPPYAALSSCLDMPEDECGIKQRMKCYTKNGITNIIDSRRCWCTVVGGNILKHLRHSNLTSSTFQDLK